MIASGRSGPAIRLLPSGCGLGFADVLTNAGHGVPGGKSARPRPLGRRRTSAGSGAAGAHVDESIPTVWSPITATRVPSRQPSAHISATHPIQGGVSSLLDRFRSVSARTGRPQDPLAAVILGPSVAARLDQMSLRPGPSPTQLDQRARQPLRCPRVVRRLPQNRRTV